MTIGQRIKTIRLEKGLTQKQVAERCGMADSAIRRYENGTMSPKVSTIQKIASALEVPASDLLGEDQEKVMVEIVEPDIDELRDEIKDLRYSLGRTGLVKTRDYMRDLMYNPENRPEPQKREQEK